MVMNDTVHKASIYSTNCHNTSQENHPTRVPTSPTYDSKQKSVRFSMPLAHTKKISSNIVPPNSTYSTFNTVHTDQYNASTNPPAILHGLPVRNKMNTESNTQLHSTPNRVPYQSYTEKYRKNKKQIKILQLCLMKKLVSPLVIQNLENLH